MILGPYERSASPWSIDGVPPEFGAELLPPDLDRIAPIIEAAMARIPALGTGGIKTVVNGPITYTPDANPLIGPAFGLDNAWLLTGSSMGIMEGGGAGWFLAHWMTHGAPPMDANAVDSRRFGAWADRSYRVEKAVEAYGLQFGIHYPHEERPAARNRRVTPLHDLLLDRGAVMGVAHGWERPNCFSDTPVALSVPGFGQPDWTEHVASEVTATTTAVGVCDMSILSKFEVSGPDARRFVETLGSNACPRLGRIARSHALTKAGGVQSEFTVTMLSETLAYLTSAAAAEEIDHDLLRRHAQGMDVTLSNVTDDFGVIAVMGPRARTLMARLTEADLSNAAFPWLSARTLTVAGVGVRALRLSYVGELGWELHIPARETAAVFVAIEAAGRDLGLTLLGAFAANSMRLEKGYRGWGSDLTTERTPDEAGLSAMVRTEGRDFPGKAALCARRDAADRWCMVLIQIDGTETPPFFGHPVLVNGHPVGIVTSGGHGFRTGATLALAYLRMAEPPDTLRVSILGRDYPALTLHRARFDPDNSRVKSDAI